MVKKKGPHRKQSLELWVTMWSYSGQDKWSLMKELDPPQSKMNLQYFPALFKKFWRVVIDMCWEVSCFLDGSVIIYIFHIGCWAYSLLL